LEEVRDILRLAAEPFSPADNRKSLIARAAKALHLTYSRAKRIWYAEDTCPMRAEEVVRLRAEADRLLRAKLARLEREIATLRRQIDAAAEEGSGLAGGQDRGVGEEAPLAGCFCS
jgi:hypothetical protein